MNKQGYVYILTNKPRGTLYIGVTSDLIKRIYQHKEKLVSGFTQKYELDQLPPINFFYPTSLPCDLVIPF